MRYKAIVFDCGDTLLTLNPCKEKICFDALTKIGIHVDLYSIKHAYQQVEFTFKHNSSELKSQYDLDDFYRKYNYLLAVALGFESKADEIDQILRISFQAQRNWSEIPDVRQSLITLSEKYILYVLANWDSKLEQLLEHLSLKMFFKSIHASADLGAEKPKKEAYHRFIELTKLDPTSCVYVGNEYLADIVGSRNIGMSPILIDRHGFYGHDIDAPKLSSLNQVDEFLLKGY